MNDSIESQVAGLVDAYLTLTTARDDRPALTSDEALWAIWRAAGERYKAEVVDALIEVIGGRRAQSAEGLPS
jgi:HD-GYP domain-containing protein (c-di-GMP phosphodiesterase class II)